VPKAPSSIKEVVLSSKNTVQVSAPTAHTSATMESAMPMETTVAQTKTELVTSHNPQLAVAETKVETPAARCAAVHVKADIHAVASCVGGNTGSISVSNFKGGKAPYRFSLTDEKGNALEPNHLASGGYQLLLFDADGCSSNTEKVEVQEKPCRKDVAFNPFVGEVWHLPVSETAGMLKIMDSGGNIHYQAKIEAGANEEWSGMSAKGEMKAGYYLYSIEYENGKTQQGSVTVAR
jgi:uncharacterized protein involved in high-affinity Fe2+ transport